MLTAFSRLFPTTFMYVCMYICMYVRLGISPRRPCTPSTAHIVECLQELHSTPSLDLDRKIRIHGHRRTGSDRLTYKVIQVQHNLGSAGKNQNNLPIHTIYLLN